MAEPGDVEGFVRELAEATIVHIERAFERAGLTVAGKPLGARAPIRYGGFDISEAGVNDGGRVWPLFYLTTDRPMDTQGKIRFPALYAYAWLARQFVRGATGQFPSGHYGAPYDPKNRGGQVEEMQTLMSASPEARLGLDLWRLGRNVAAEAAQFDPGWLPDPDEYGFETNSGDIEVPEIIRRILESVRGRLNWPSLPDDYDPPPPSQWPADLDESLPDSFPAASATRAAVKRVFARETRTRDAAWFREAIPDQHSPDRWSSNSVVAVIFREYGIPDPYDGNAVEDWNRIAEQVSKEVGYRVRWESYNAGVILLHREILGGGLGSLAAGALLLTLGLRALRSGGA